MVTEQATTHHIYCLLSGISPLLQRGNGGVRYVQHGRQGNEYMEMG